MDHFLAKGLRIHPVSDVLEQLDQVRTTFTAAGHTGVSSTIHYMGTLLPGIGN